MWLSTRRSFPVLKILLIVSVPQPDTMSAATTALDYEDKYIALIWRVCKRGISCRWVCHEMKQTWGYISDKFHNILNKVSVLTLIITSSAIGCVLTKSSSSFVRSRISLKLSFPTRWRSDRASRSNRAAHRLSGPMHLEKRKWTLVIRQKICHKIRTRNYSTKWSWA